MEFSLDRFERYDIWLLFSIGFENENDLENIIAIGDGINHSVFMPKELNFGLNKLIYNGYVEQIEKGKFKATEKAIIFRNQHKRKNEGYLSEMCRLGDILVKTAVLKECQYTEYVSDKEFKRATDAYLKKMSEILKNIRVNP